MGHMKHPIPLLFPPEPPAPEPVRVELTVEIVSCMATLLLQALELTTDREEDDDEA